MTQAAERPGWREVGYRDRTGLKRRHTFWRGVLPPLRLESRHKCNQQRGAEGALSRQTRKSISVGRRWREEINHKHWHPLETIPEAGEALQKSLSF